MSKITIKDLSKLVGDEVMLLDERISKLEKRILFLEINLLTMMRNCNLNCQKVHLADRNFAKTKARRMKYGYVKN